MGASQRTNALGQSPLFSLHQKDRCQERRRPDRGSEDCISTGLNRLARARGGPTRSKIGNRHAGAGLPLSPESGQSAHCKSIRDIESKRSACTFPDRVEMQAADCAGQCAALILQELQPA